MSAVAGTATAQVEGQDSKDKEKGKHKDEEQAIKCLVWDLDHTLWDGILLEDPQVTLKPGVEDIIRTLDERGILHSIASRNEPELAMQKLREFGLADYFLWPQIGWNPKSDAVRTISERLSLGLDTFAFVDDQAFELAEVAYAHPKVLCINSADMDGILDLKRMHPRFITPESRTRRSMYMSDVRRQEAEGEYTGTNESFLAQLDMEFTITPVTEEDLKRAEELTVRTHQLNTTGYTYSYDDLDALRHSRDHLLLIAGLDDTFGSYGKIGLCVVDLAPDAWTIKLLLMSCRVISRGVGNVLLTHLMRLAKQAGVKLRAEFIQTNRNRMMYITYKFAGFRQVEDRGGSVLLEHDLAQVPEFPGYIRVRT